MIVNGGKTFLLDLQETGLASCYWALFTSNTTITSATVRTDLTEAGWTSYARQPVSSYGASAIVGGRASVVPTFPVFSNGSGSPVTFYVWGLVTLSSGGVLVAAENIGATSIAAGGSFALAPTFTDTQE